MTKAKKRRPSKQKTKYYSSNSLICERLKKTIWWIWQLSGIRLVYRKLIPQKEIKEEYIRPSSFIFWILGIYFAAYGIASQRYENRLDALETKVNLLHSQLAMSDIDVRKNAFSRIGELQNTLLPVKPELLSPMSVFESFTKEEKNIETIEELKKTICANIRLLPQAILFDVDISNCRFDKIDLANISLVRANCRGTTFSDCDLKHAHFYRVECDKKTTFNCSRMINADFTKSNLSGAHFSQNYLIGVSFDFADLDKTTFWNVVMAGSKFEKSLNFSNAIFTNSKYLCIPGQIKRGKKFYCALNNNEPILTRINSLYCGNTLFPKDYDPTANKELVNIWNYVDGSIKCSKKKENEIIGIFKEINKQVKEFLISSNNRVMEHSNSRYK